MRNVQRPSAEFFFHFLHAIHCFFCLSVVIEDMMDDEVISADMLREVGTFEGPELSAEDDEG